MSYLPGPESEQIKWMNNFVAKLAVHATTVSVSASELAAAQADVAFLTYLQHDLLPLYRAKAKEVTAYKDLLKDGPLGSPGGTLPAAPAPPTAPTAVLPGVMPRLTALVQRIKNAPGYNEAIAADLDILPPAPRTLVADQQKPTFTATVLPGSQVRLDWVKGKMDGVRVESKRASEQEWSHLGDDRYSPFVDTRAPAQPGPSEVRSYRLRYLLKDELVGVFSDTATILTTP
jgi:hypothetical protein